MSYSNGLLSDQSYQTANKYVQRGLPGVGFKLTVTGDYDVQNKKLVNVDEGENNQDVVNKHQLDVGLQTKPNKTSVLLLDGTTHMVGDLDLRGNKIILPGEIQMDRKLITNLDTDENQDLSAVNMITLKNKVEPKADKNYVDFEITKQNALINNAFVKKTGDQMNGDLILPHDSYPVGGNTNKAISYETQREIFLSRQESFPMQADINMNNNFIQNIATPTSSHQVTNKGYCDYNFLNRQSGGVLMGPLSMNRNDLTGIPDTPKFGYSAVNKNYVDGEISKIPGTDTSPFLKIDGSRAMTGNLDMGDHSIQKVIDPVNSDDVATKNYVDAEIGYISTPFLKLDGTRAMTGILNMNTHKISNVVNPEFDTDVVNKQYLENKLIESHLQPSGPSNIFHFLMNDTSKFSSIREIIIGSFSDVEKVAHRLNKKALSILLQNDLQTVSYSARLGLDMTSLSVGDYTLVMEFYWPEKFNIYTYADSTPTNIVDEQNIKNFSNYQKLYLQFTKKNTNSPNNLIMEIRGELSSSNQQTGYLIFYGAKGTHYSITNDFYDQYIMSDIFIYNENMKMQTKIDMNNNKIIKLSNGTDPDDVVNKQQLDSVNLNLETFKNQINTFKFHFKNYFYLSIFTYRFYDLKEPSTFILDGPAISGINPNMSIISSGSNHITVSGFDPIRGLQFNSATKIIIDLGYMVNQNTPYTIMISLTLKGHLNVNFVDPTNEQTVYYPRYIVNPSDHSIKLQLSQTVFSGSRIYPVVLNNKQTMIWIYFNPSERKYEIIIGNGNYFYRILNPLSYFSTNKLRIDASNNIINKICYQNQFIALGETFTKMMFEERKNGSYFKKYYNLTNIYENSNID